MRRHLALVIALIFFVLLIVAPVPALAETVMDRINAAGPQGGTVERGGMIEQMLAAIINDIAGALRVTGLMPISTMLYNVTPTTTEGQQWGIAPHRWDQWMLRDDQWMNFAMPAYQAFMAVAMGLLLLTFISGGMKLSIHSGSPQARAKASSSILLWFIGSILFLALPTLINILLDINRGLVSVATGLIGIDVIRGMDARLFSETITTGNVLLTALVNLALVVFMLWFNVIFFIRWFVVTALFSIAPLSIWTWMKGQQSSFFLWLGELISNILMQFVYALVFGMAILVLMSPDLERNWLINLVTLTMVIPVAKLLRTMITQWLNIIGLDEEGQSRSVVGGGMGSLMAVGSAITGTRGGGGHVSAGANYGGGGPGGSSGSGGSSGGGSSGGGSGNIAGGGGGGIGGFATKAMGAAGSIATKAAAFGAGTLTAAALAPVTGWENAGTYGRKVAGGTQHAASAAGAYLESRKKNNPSDESKPSQNNIKSNQNTPPPIGSGPQASASPDAGQNIQLPTANEINTYGRQPSSGYSRHLPDYPQEDGPHGKAPMFQMFPATEFAPTEGQAPNAASYPAPSQPIASAPTATSDEPAKSIEWDEYSAYRGQSM